MSTDLTTRIEGRINKDVSAQTGLTKTGAMAFSNVEQIMEFGKIMAVAGIGVPKHLRDCPGACLAVAIQASEWEMSPFAVANKSYVVNDRLAYEAQLINAVILKRAPIVGRLKISYSGEGATRRCKVAAQLEDGEMVDYESPQFQTIPVKNSPLWKGDPDQQLFYYSSRAMCRRHFPDVILGVYSVDELEDMPPMRDITPARITETGALIPPPRKTREKAAPQDRSAETPSAQPQEPRNLDLRDAMSADSISLQRINAVCESAAFGGPYASVNDIPANVAAGLLKSWDSVKEAELA